MTIGRTKRTNYQLRKSPRQDYYRQLQGLPILRKALTTSVGEATQGETNMTTELDRLTAIVARMAQNQEEHQQREEERQQ